MINKVLEHNGTAAAHTRQLPALGTALLPARRPRDLG